MPTESDRPVEAFVLLEAKAGAAMELVRQLKGVPGVRSVHAVTGPYDVIVHVEAPDVRALGQFVVSRVQAPAQVSRSITCIVVEA